MYTLATLHQLRQRLGLAAADTADDTRLLTALQAASAQIERLANRRFSPFRAALPHTVNPRYPIELVLEEDLLELLALTNGDVSAISLNAVLKLPAAPPYALLERTDGQAFTWNLTPVQAVTVTGLWGYHDDWTRAWYPSGDTVKNSALTAAATAIEISDATATATATNGEAPRFQVGQLLRVGEEYLRVLAVNVIPSANDTLTVLRGVNGTTPTAHAQNTPIDIFQPLFDVQMLTLRWAAWLYREPDSRAFTAPPVHLVRSLDHLARHTVKS